MKVRTIGAIIAAVLTFGALSRLTSKDMQAAGNGPPSPAPKQQTIGQPDYDAKFFSAARQRVLVQLKDPDSAKFRGLLVTKAGVVCGLVNAKNSFGGYIGYGHFIDDHGLVLLDQGTRSPHFNAYWNMVCANKQGYFE